MVLVKKEQIGEIVEDELRPKATQTNVVLGADRSGSPVSPEQVLGQRDDPGVAVLHWCLCSQGMELGGCAL